MTQAIRTATRPEKTSGDSNGDGDVDGDGETEGDGEAGGDSDSVAVADACAPGEAEGVPEAALSVREPKPQATSSIAVTMSKTPAAIGDRTKSLTPHFTEIFPSAKFPCPFLIYARRRIPV